MIEVNNVSFKYEDEIVLKNISLKIKEGSFTAVIGSNGCGKTTLAKHLNGILTPAKGDVIVDGFSTKHSSFETRKRVGFVFQNFEDQLVYSIADEDVAFGLENLGIGADEIKRTVNETLRSLKIENLQKRNVNTISQGQKQLVALAGVLAMNPKYIVFDEPTTMLDVKNKKNILKMIYDLNKKNNIAIVLVTNVLDDLKYADRIVLMKEGRVIFNDKKLALKKRLLQEAGLID
ncbi:MAG: ATP-binding cassette domain-containing protein [Nanoarchaeota archaeon]